MYELTSGIFWTTLLAPFPVFAATPPAVVPAEFAFVALATWLDDVFVDELFAPPSDAVLILEVVIAVLELTDDVPLLTVFAELKKTKKKLNGENFHFLLLFRAN